VKQTVAGASCTRTRIIVALTLQTLQSGSNTTSQHHTALFKVNGRDVASKEEEEE